MLSECTWQAKRGMRTKDWKYIRCWDPGIYERTEAELYDVIADPAEQHDVSAEHPDVAATMDSVHGRLARRGSVPEAPIRWTR